MKPKTKFITFVQSNTLITSKVVMFYRLKLQEMSARKSEYLRSATPTLVKEYSKWDLRGFDGTPHMSGQYYTYTLM